MTHSGGSSTTDRTPTDRSAPPREQFRLTGHSASLDPTVHALRGDLADVTLAAKVFAPHYARAVPFAAVSATPILARPKADATPAGQLLVGDMFDVLDFNGGWAWGRTPFAVGYVPEAALERK